MAEESEALALVRQLKSTHDLSVILATIGNSLSPSLPLPSELAIPDDILLPTEPEETCELTLQHQVICPARTSIDIAPMDTDSLVPTRVTPIPSSGWCIAWDNNQSEENNGG
jgi:hypothetical protein